LPDKSFCHLPTFGSAAFSRRKTVFHRFALRTMESRTMPRLVHALPKYRLYKGSGKAVDTLNGKDYYLGRTAQLLADASTIASSANS
jgi:hypothetical protein